MASRPPWLDEELLSRVLAGADIEAFDVKEAVADGDHYFSTLLRVRVKYTPKDERIKEASSVNFILKSLPKGVMTDFMVESGIMEKELTMYKSVLPLIEDVTSYPVSPKYHECKRKDVIILEDLVSSGFAMEDRIKRLDFEHCLAAVRLLADFHASSILLHPKDGDVIKKAGNEVLYVPGNEYMESFIVNCFQVLSKEIETWPELEGYASKIRDAGPRIWNMMLEAVDVPQGVLKVLNHGDFWTNNILYKHDAKGSVEELKVIDFQFARWSTQSMDLQMLFNTSVRDLAVLPRLTAAYLDRFNEISKPAGISITSEELDKAIRRTDCYGLLAAVCLLPTCVLSPQSPLSAKAVTREDYGENFHTDNPYVKACKDPTFKSILPAYIELYVTKGLL